MLDLINQYQKKEVQEYENKTGEFIPLVSVVALTYNHKNFICECIEGILMQQTTFPIEIIIGEDESRDGTREICLEYAQKYPGKIRLFLNCRENNICINGNPTGRFNVIYSYSKARGKYIALCEGDDYWTDPLKLQKQVDFLEANEDYSICFHRVFELEKDKEIVLSNLNTSLKEETYTIEDLARYNFIHTPSVIFRNGLIKKLPDWFKDSPVGDYVLHMLNAKLGKIKYFPTAMAVYRQNIGIWSTQSKQNRLRSWLTVLNLLIAHFDRLEVLENLIKQKEHILIYLKSENDPVFFNKEYMLHKRLFDTIDEKNAEIEQLKNRFLSLEKNVGVRDLANALIKKVYLKIFGH